MLKKNRTAIHQAISNYQKPPCVLHQHFKIQIFIPSEILTLNFQLTAIAFPIVPLPNKHQNILCILCQHQSSDLQSTSENGQLQSYGANFIVNVNCVPESASTQPGHPRQYGVAPGSELPFASETIHLDDIRRQYCENCNEWDFKANELHGNLS